jgi:hypothetical protein
MKKLYLVFILVLLLLIIGCRGDDNEKAEYIHFVYDTNTLNKFSDEAKFVFNSEGEVVAKISEISDIGIVHNDEIFKDYKILVLVIPYYDRVYLNNIKLEDKNLVFDLYTSSKYNENSSIVLGVRIDKDIAFDDFTYTIREPIGTDGEVEFIAFEHSSFKDLTRYDYEIGVNIAPTHESIIINNYSLFCMYVKKNPGYTSFDISRYNQAFFKDKTLIIYNIDSNKEFVMSTLAVEIANGKVMTKFGMPSIYGNASKYFSMWVEIRKNETITQAEYTIDEL